MKAFVYRVGTDDTDQLGTGRVSPLYHNFGNFMRHFMQKLPPGTYRAYLYDNWAARSRTPDAIKVITVNPQGAAPCIS